MYTFLAIYVIANLLLFLGEAVYESRRHQDFQKYTTAIARGCGATLNLNMAVVILLASRSALDLLRQTPLNMALPIDKAMPDLHRVVGTVTVVAGVLHAVFHWVTYIVKSPWSGGYSGLTSLFVTGMLLFIVIIIVRVVAIAEIYHSYYEVFHRLHIGGSVISYILLLVHGLHQGAPSSWKWVVGPIIIYCLDVGYRLFQEKRSYLLVSKHSAVFQSPDIIKIRLPRVFHFQAGQYAELKVPNISRFQWHPFTISSAPHEPEMIFYIKAAGDWTNSLYVLFRQRINADDPEDIEVHIRGPYGAPAQHVGQFDRVVLVGGGVGATPFCSVVKDAYNWITNWTPRRYGKREGDHRRHITNNLRDTVLNIEGGKDEENHRPERRTANRRRCSENEVFPRDTSSHLFTTNVFSENLESLGVLDDIRRLDMYDRSRSNRRHGIDGMKLASGNGNADHHEDLRGSSMYTARDYLAPVELSSSSSGASLSRESAASTSSQGKDTSKSISGEGTEYHTALGSDDHKPSFIKKLSSRFLKGPNASEEDGMGCYHDNSSGTYRRSLDYMSALHFAYSERQQDQVFQQSLDLMLGMSFGSVSLVRNMQLRRAQRNMRLPSGERELPAISPEDLSLLQNPRIMFLLFMRSVTVNMVSLWVLLLRFVIAGVAHIFGSFRLFAQGIALYSSPALLSVDLALALVVTILIGTPSVIEILELGAAPVHGFDLFVLMPAALFGVVVDAVALTGIARDVNLFTVVHVFVVWPILTILILVRLLRVVGERIAQAQNLTTTHSTTRKVDFFWTAPTPEDDKWLVDELKPYANVEYVQMHRNLTRTQPTSRMKKNRLKSDSIQTSYGRPKWSDIMNEMTEKCPNNTTIGVFFCGPHRMGAELQEACMSAMRNSIVRGLHAGARAMRGLEEVFGDAISANEYTGDASKPSRPGARGCNVKIVFKRETFA